MHVDVYMATPALQSLTHETLCDTGQRTADTLKITNHHLPITKSLHFKPSILVFFCGEATKKHRWKKCLKIKHKATLIIIFKMSVNLLKLVAGFRAILYFSVKMFIEVFNKLWLLRLILERYHSIWKFPVFKSKMSHISITNSR